MPITNMERPDEGLPGAQEFSIVGISRAWHEGGSKSPVATKPSLGAICALPKCNGLAWVKLKTSRDAKQLCFRHYEAVVAA